VQHTAHLLEQAGIHCQPVGHNGCFTFYHGDDNMAFVKVVPWDSRMACLSEMEPVSQWGVSIWLRNECLTARDMQTLWSVYEGFYCPSPPNPVLVSSPGYEKEFQVIRFCMDDGGINFMALPGTSLEHIPEHLQFIAEAFDCDGFPFEPDAWQVMTEVLRRMGDRCAMD